MRIYKTKVFDRWLKKTELTDADLIRAVNEMSNGLIDADLGEQVFKKRIALPGRGKRSGVRTLVASKIQDQWFFCMVLPRMNATVFLIKSSGLYKPLLAVGWNRNNTCCNALLKVEN
ncbi:MAG: type II toxin-antitoxin system RelE/ParE family toxin [Nitrosomonas sp.]|nr:type II toxin-antitoxin system RelE/ParE family toxin [Nitrosomonas sp.]MCW5608149.1 type II toxin-antitoxin system RelE/ParE family toxin [Nitrosomonas sp.]